MIDKVSDRWNKILEAARKRKRRRILNDKIRSEARRDLLVEMENEIQDLIDRSEQMPHEPDVVFKTYIEVLQIVQNHIRSKMNND